MNIVPITDINVLSLKSETVDKVTYDYKINNIKAPVKVGEVIGTVDIINNGKVVNTVELTVEEDISKVNLLIEIIRNLKDVISGTL